MRICITLDDVIRAKTLQFGKIYKKYIDPEIDLDSLDLSSGDLQEIFGFESKENFNDFLYKDYAFEIFAEATTTDKMVDKKLNLWHLSLEDREEDVELIIANPREFNFSIGYTCFFLSKIAPHTREIYFPKNTLDIWDKCDVLITADKALLENKPEGKTSIKIEMPYNEGINANFTYSSLMEMLNDKELNQNIFGNG